VAVALVRSFNNSLFTAGNIGFKRDLQNQSEQAVQLVLTEFKEGVLSTAAGRKVKLADKNYSAVILPTNAQGIPNALLDLSTAGFTQADSVFSGQIKLRYVIDRLCAIEGDETTIGATDNCRLAGDPVPIGTGLANLRGADRTINGKRGAATQSVLYRLSIRATGPRNTQSFFQSTFTVPS
jgi:type IV pilus assembly protein PilX